jgi:hypothetical protein
LIQVVPYSSIPAISISTSPFSSIFFFVVSLLTCSTLVIIVVVVIAQLFRPKHRSFFAFFTFSLIRCFLQFGIFGCERGVVPFLATLTFSTYSPLPPTGITYTP